MVTGLPKEAPSLAGLMVALSAVLGLKGALDGTPAAVDRFFPAGHAQPLRTERMTICGRVGSYRRYCGLPEDFMGPVEDPRRQWHRRDR